MDVYDFLMMLCNEDIPVDIFDLNKGEVVATYERASDAMDSKYSYCEVSSFDATVSDDTFIKAQNGLKHLPCPKVCLNLELDDEDFDDEDDEEEEW